MQEDWSVECSDDEIRDKPNWEPSPEEIDRLYTMMDKGEVPEISWKCPGYRSPSPEVTDKLEENENSAPLEDKSDFDFMDEASSPTLKMRKDGEDALKGSAKRKVTSLDGVISNMRRHNLLPTQPKGS
ncbi:hypothetical protein PPYR_14736 [Photinus pyralis]|uniref:PAXIP1-associated glutamate-rich protein 1 n=2 Tax=Photinus pyralis TaxID=7054 RepID=A0A5N4A628_PHOPY|nr:PAXIP1-associated glutamate-rich protein 1-like [Photinus pyralis]XP_031356510.1 PAXIP1-associated glutamate-rich protein 1-like [Photinus pyralis]KAB0792750.1 hypothetical protein PPYR_14709 [Photinus pyralis]KAB0792777.1 hypothetical protein PPYR_14736 [Photinus pyralis]